jgi:hypothetical protein
MDEPSTGRMVQEVDRQLSVAEARAYLNSPISAFEREDVLALKRWFAPDTPRPWRDWPTSDRRISRRGDASRTPFVEAHSLMGTGVGWI